MEGIGVAAPPQFFVSICAYCMHRPIYLDLPVKLFKCGWGREGGMEGKNQAMQTYWSVILVRNSFKCPSSLIQFNQCNHYVYSHQSINQSRSFATILSQIKTNKSNVFFRNIQKLGKKLQEEIIRSVTPGGLCGPLTHDAIYRHKSSLSQAPRPKPNPLTH